MKKKSRDRMASAVLYTFVSGLQKQPWSMLNLVREAIFTASRGEETR